MSGNKDFKSKIKRLALKSPSKYYPVLALKEHNFSRKLCKKCYVYFWSLDKDREYCGNPSCSGGYTFIGNSPAKKKLSYIQVWKNFSKIHKNLGYSPIARYPVVSRWNPTTEFTIASIAAFQPYVVSGEVEPPANPLVIPQFCLRFNDVDSVGLSGHFTGFVMMGQHAFVPPKKYNINKYFSHHLTWLNKGLGISNKHLTIHEDAWEGGGNLGTSVEFFSNGLEISNQVYMQFELLNSKIKELKIKVLDMGQGQERAAWITQGSFNSYEATFPSVINFLIKKSGININKKLMKKLMPYTAHLNLGEIKNIEDSWQYIATKLAMPKEEIKEYMLNLSSLFSIAEHTRSLLIAISDGKLPSNVGGGYNLRLLARRAFSFIDNQNWNISLPELCSLHAKELNSQYPELKENLEGVSEILEMERKKYNETKKRSKEILSKILGSSISEPQLIQLYDSHGISPELIKEESKRINKIVKIPQNFYSKVSERQEKSVQKHATKKEEKLILPNLPPTKPLYYKDYKLSKNKARVLKIINNLVILDKTVAYPTSGGQLHDLGTINNQPFVDVFKQGNIIIHKLKDKPKFKEKNFVNVKIDRNRRVQLAQNHTATHIVNAAARNVLGKHINQSSAFKDVDKARLDITHFKNITEDELKQIEEESNKIIKSKLPIVKKIMSRKEAEKKYGFSIYQGPAVPGKELRIVKIKGLDIECCGGTHLDNTKEAIKIKILKSSKISDSISRIEFVAGNKALEAEHNESKLLSEIAKILKIRKKQIPARVQELFAIWKAKVKKHKEIQVKFTSREQSKISDKEMLVKTAQILKTQPQHIIKTIKRFLNDLKSN